MLFRTLVASTIAVLSTLGETASYHQSEDPKCPEGTFSGFETNVWQFNAPPSGFIDKTGSFFQSEWYTGRKLVATHGKDDTIGSLRVGIFEGLTYIEELAGHYRSPTQSVLRYFLHNGTFPLPEGFTLVAYTEEFRVMSICGGAGTYFSMTATYCTDDVVYAYDFIDKFRRNAIGAVAKELNAHVFAGTCPVGGQA